MGLLESARLHSLISATSGEITLFPNKSALVKMIYDILISIDVGKCTVLASLDLSAAFDANNHKSLLNILQYLYRISGTSFKWFQPYIEHINKQVCVEEPLSQSQPVISGAPQGSVLGAILFTMHTYPPEFQQVQGGVLQLCG